MQNKVRRIPRQKFDYIKDKVAIRLPYPTFVLRDTHGAFVDTQEAEMLMRNAICSAADACIADNPEIEFPLRRAEVRIGFLNCNKDTSCENWMAPDVIEHGLIEHGLLRSFYSTESFETYFAIEDRVLKPEHSNAFDLGGLPDHYYEHLAPCTQVEISDLDTRDVILRSDMAQMRKKSRLIRKEIESVISGDALPRDLLSDGDSNSNKLLSEHGLSADLFGNNALSQLQLLGCMSVAADALERKAKSEYRKIYKEDLPNICLNLDSEEMLVGDGGDSPRVLTFDGFIDPFWLN